MKALRSVAGTLLAAAMAALLLATQAVLAASPCLMPTTNVSMAFAHESMSQPCAGAGTNVCLLACLQADRLPTAEKSTQPDVMGPADAAAWPDVDRAPFAEPGLLAPPTPPPPRLLFCRLLR